MTEQAANKRWRSLKLVRNLVLLMAVMYLCFWGSLAVYFSFAETHKDALQSQLSSMFDRPVSIRSVRTQWQGMSPHIQIQGLLVAGDTEAQPALAFESLSASVQPLSLLRFWPKFDEFALEKPVLEVVTHEDGQIQIAGVLLSKQNSGRATPERLLRWMLDQPAAAWHSGEIVWVRASGELKRYRDISFVYQREQQLRTISATLTSDRGPLAFKATSQGDLLADDLWDASLEVLGDQQTRIVRSQDLSLTVEDGQGRLLLKELEVVRVREFLRLLGLRRDARWIFDADLNGVLHDVEFTFSGPLLAMENWTLSAAASGVGFNAIDPIPGMNNLRGELNASADGGVFEFTAEDARFEWPKIYNRVVPIETASGEFTWRINDDDTVTIGLIEGQLTDGVASISDLNATCRLERGIETVTSFGQLFKVESVRELSFEDGLIVNTPDSLSERPLMVNANAEFAFNDLSRFVDYLPNDSRVDKFREWSESAFVRGEIFNGRASYRGELTRNALIVGKAQFEASADFDNAEVDYGFQRDWPAAKQGRGKATIRNQLLTIVPDALQLNGEAVTDGQLQIARLFEPTRALLVHGKTQTSLRKGMDFLFKGPLISPESRPDTLPVEVTGGTVDIDVAVEIPLDDMDSTSVRGTAVVRNGSGVLPEGVPLTKVNGAVSFTERSVTSENVRARFLGGDTYGRLVTVREAQPPVMKLIARGEADVTSLEPWVGEHILTWLDGVADWQGDLLIDGPSLQINGQSELLGVAVSAPAPLAKAADEVANLALSMTIGDDDVLPNLALNYNDDVAVRMQGAKPIASSGTGSSLFDRSLISIGTGPARQLKPGINFVIDDDGVNLDDWLTAVIDLASHTPKQESNNTDFLDAMRSIEIRSANPVLLGREFGNLAVSAASVDGFKWVGTLDGDNIRGTMTMRPRDRIGQYEFDLSEFHLVDAPEDDTPATAIDYTLQPSAYPSITLNVDALKVTGKNLGSLRFRGRPKDDQWLTEEFVVTQNGIRTEARGGWRNNAADGSVTSFDFNTSIEEAEGALTDMDFDGVIKRGTGTLKGNINWIGAPHEFDYARLNGEFDLSVRDGELIQVEPGSGKLLGLLNFNAIARRLIFDFRDVFASGLKFDRMRYNGLLAEGEAIFREAYIFSPAVFVSMEGKLDLDEELIDMEVHLSPELGGNLTLLSALANPTAGAVVFLTQRIFKDEMRESSFKSYRALGTWQDFEMVEIKDGPVTPDSAPVSDVDSPTPPTTDASGRQPSESLARTPEPEPES
ncbi:hypothetical protein GCM10008090_21910 [Arenicella chitinivorans]|uniref:YhdP central domain-containing protein n=1 Tax=Arenicella chitinivorans TaxID=1329800 RepID=A0A918VPA5_9GAMM|nr:AsmA-like C-terminal region-containing protein [Arenicella chitinivorans]GHA11751.1 hypothetical protein GCM10008090_21910 [Arenicella chitinivorans]